MKFSLHKQRTIPWEIHKGARTIPISVLHTPGLQGRTAEREPFVFRRADKVHFLVLLHP